MVYYFFGCCCCSYCWLLLKGFCFLTVWCSLHQQQFVARWNALKIDKTNYQLKGRVENDEQKLHNSMEKARESEWVRAATKLKERKNLIFIYLTVAISAKSQNVDHHSGVCVCWRSLALFQLYLTELRNSNLFMLRTIFLRLSVTGVQCIDSNFNCESNFNVRKTILHVI